MAWRDYGYVITSKHRSKVLKTLITHPKTPKQISKEANISLSHVSRALKELVARELVSCINPHDIKGRVYKLTERGKEIAKVMEKNQAENA